MNEAIEQWFSKLNTSFSYWWVTEETRKKLFEELEWNDLEKTTNQWILTNKTQELYKLFEDNNLLVNDEENQEQKNADTIEALVSFLREWTWFFGNWKVKDIFKINWLFPQNRREMKRWIRSFSEFGENLWNNLFKNNWKWILSWLKWNWIKNLLDILQLSTNLPPRLNTPQTWTLWLYKKYAFIDNPIKRITQSIEKKIEIRKNMRIEQKNKEIRQRWKIYLNSTYSIFKHIWATLFNQKINETIANKPKLYKSAILEKSETMAYITTLTDTIQKYLRWEIEKIDMTEIINIAKIQTEYYKWIVEKKEEELRKNNWILKPDNDLKEITYNKETIDNLLNKTETVVLKSKIDKFNINWLIWELSIVSWKDEEVEKEVEKEVKKLVRFSFLKNEILKKYPNTIKKEFLDKYAEKILSNIYNRIKDDRIKDDKWKWWIEEQIKNLRSKIDIEINYDDTALLKEMTTIIENKFWTQKHLYNMRFDKIYNKVKEKYQSLTDEESKKIVKLSLIKVMKDNLATIAIDDEKLRELENNLKKINDYWIIKDEIIKNEDYNALKNAVT